jgi:hypothetical protein
MMDIKFGNSALDVKYINMQDQFNELLPDALRMSHYELAKVTKYNSTDWRSFFTHPQVADWINEEIELLKQNKFKILLDNADSFSKSPGHAQLLSALLSSMKKETKKEGPAFVYCYIPLNENEEAAENVRILKKDPFKVEE